MSPEIHERHRIADDLDKALLRLDLDGLRFVLCVALIRGMSPESLDKLNERIKVVEPKKPAVQP